MTWDQFIDILDKRVTDPIVWQSYVRKTRVSDEEVVLLRSPIRGTSKVTPQYQLGELMNQREEELSRNKECWE